MMPLAELNPRVTSLLALFAVLTVKMGEDDTAGTIVYANDLIASLTGWHKSEIVGKNLNVLVPERFQRAHGHYMLGFCMRPSPRPMGPDRRVVLLHRNGREIPVWIGLDPDSLEDPKTVTAVILPLDVSLREFLL